MASTNFWLQSLKPHNPVDIRQQPPLRLHRSIVLLQFRELVEIARILFQLCALSPLTQNSKNSSNCSEQQCAVPYFDEKKSRAKKIRQIPAEFCILIRFLFRITSHGQIRYIDPMTRNATPLSNQAVHHLHLDSIGAANLPSPAQACRRRGPDGHGTDRGTSQSLISVLLFISYMYWVS